jgi:hypothetical protein
MILVTALKPVILYNFGMYCSIVYTTLVAFFPMFMIANGYVIIPLLAIILGLSFLLLRHVYNRSVYSRIYFCFK